MKSKYEGEICSLICNVMCVFALITLPGLFNVGSAQAVSSIKFEILTDSSIELIDPRTTNSEEFPFDTLGDEKIYTVILAEGLEYGGCDLGYLEGREILVYWTPPKGFSSYSRDKYELLLFITTSSLQLSERSDVVQLSIGGPKGRTQGAINDLEITSNNPYNWSDSTELFFQSAFLAKHFNHTFRPPHGLAKRTARISVDRLVIAQDKGKKAPIRLRFMPGEAYENLVRENFPDESDPNVVALRGIKFDFFTDVNWALERIGTLETSGAEDSQKECRKAYDVLTQLRACHGSLSDKDKIFIEEEFDVIDTGVRNLEDEESGDNIDLSARILEAKGYCPNPAGQ